MYILNIKTGFIASGGIAILTAYYFIIPIAEALNSHSINFTSTNSQYLSRTVPVGLPSGSAQRTTEAWVKTTKTSEQAILEYGTDAGSYHTWELVVAENSIGIRLNGANTFWAAPAVTDGNWHHVAFVYSGSGALDTNTVAYLDGNILIQTSAVSAIPDTLDNWIYIGAAGSPPGGFFNGQLDEVRVWNVARTGAEIAANRSIELNGDEAGLVGYWKFNGSSLEDSTANNNDLANNNGAGFSTDVPFPTPPVVVMQSKVRKLISESVTSSVVLQADDHLKVNVEAGKTYEVDGVLFVTSPNAAPDLRIAMNVPSGSDMNIGYQAISGGAVSGGVLESDGISSERIKINAQGVVPISIKGTLVAGAHGTLQLEWAQFQSRSGAVTVKKGSFLKVEEI